MRRCTRTPVRLYLDSTFLPDDFADDLERLKEESGLTWEGLADVLGVDPRQLQRWRGGTKPSADGLYALLRLGAQVPGGVQMVLRMPVMPHPGPFRPVRLAVGAGGVNG